MLGHNLLYMLPLAVLLAGLLVPQTSAIGMYLYTSVSIA